MLLMLFILTKVHLRLSKGQPDFTHRGWSHRWHSSPYEDGKILEIKCHYNKMFWTMDWEANMDSVITLTDVVFVKDARSVSFRSELFTSYIFTIFKQRNRLPKYEKLPNIVIHACKNSTEKMYLMKKSGPQIWLCLFKFRSRASKQLNGLTTIHSVDSVVQW